MKFRGTACSMPKNEFSFQQLYKIYIWGQRDEGLHSYGNAGYQEHIPKKVPRQRKKKSAPPTSLTVQLLALWMNNCSYDL